MEQEAFLWERHAAAEEYLLGRVRDYVSHNKVLRRLSERLHHETSSRLLDWTDHIGVEYTDVEEEKVKAAGFEVEEEVDGYQLWWHPRAQLPRVVLHDPEKFRLHGISLKVDSIPYFLQLRGLSAAIEGAPFSGYRRCSVAVENGVELWVEERRGTRTIEPTYPEAEQMGRYFHARERWCTRPRHWEDQEEALKVSIQRAQEMIDLVGRDMAAHLVCEVEREYWQSRNRAAEVQKARQDRVGMGWANHDHHTFRSSRQLFPDLVSLFELLGFHCRERFYAGEEAGWGAQVMENPNAGLVLFLDVDLAPNEVEIDFAHHTLEPHDALGTVGLWCGLHGDSILSAGMHHLEAQFYFDDLTADLSQYGIGMMEPFSNFDHLKQAFTQAEQWNVSAHRIRHLLKVGSITEEQAKTFLDKGAVGSHLENLQRRDGFKGFNQQNVSYIIRATDPRDLSADLGGA